MEETKTPPLVTIKSVKAAKKPFKICFVPKREAGRSYVQVDKPLGTVMPRMPKFYIKRPEISCDDLNAKIATLQVTNLHEKYSSPQTENQSYGWYKMDIEKADRLNYAKRPHPMIQDNLMNFAKIRE